MTVGRSKTFDESLVLRKAQQVFWRRGFLSAPMSELTAIMGINKPSLYATYGDKENLYLLSMRDYLAEFVQPRLALLAGERPVRTEIRQVLLAFAELFTNAEFPGGCFVVTGSFDISPTLPPQIAAELLAALQSLESALKVRLSKAQHDQEIPVKSDLAVIANSLAIFLSGLAVKAKAGESLIELTQAIELTVEMFLE